MTRGRAASAVGAVAAAAALAVPAAAQERSDDPRQRMVAHVGTQFLRAAVGEYCLDKRRDDGQVSARDCQDVFVPLRPRPRIAVRAGRSMELRFRVAPRRVYVSLEGPKRPGATTASVLAEPRPRRTDAGGLRWRIRVPARACRATYARIYATLPDDDYVAFYVGLRVRR